MSLLRNFRVEFSGSGDIIIEQSLRGERLISDKLRLLLINSHIFYIYLQITLKCVYIT